MFPFHGMAGWARALGEVLPLTHFLRVVRGVLLKSLPDAAVWSVAWPMGVFALAAGAISLTLYGRRIGWARACRRAHATAGPDANIIRVE